MEDYKDCVSVDQEQDFIINDVTPNEQESVIKENEALNEPSEVDQDLEDNVEDKTGICPDDSSNEKVPTNPNVEESLSNSVALLNSLQENLLRLEEKFDKKIAEDTHKNSLFDKMYEELASYKKDLYAKLVGPFVNETISLLDDYERLIERIDTIDYEKLKKYVMGIPDDLESILDNNGVERYTDDTEKFNPKTQRVVKTIPTGNMELENIIAERTRKGYRWNGVMLKPEMVKIYKYKDGYIDPVTDVKQEEQNSLDNYSSEEKTETAIENNQN
jgi:molecular chaperone GrpE (heat shock protein)